MQRPTLLSRTLLTAIGSRVMSQLPPLVQAAGTITGTVFRDYNTDGTRDGSEPCVDDITVTAYDAATMMLPRHRGGRDRSRWSQARTTRTGGRVWWSMSRRRLCWSASPQRGRRTRS
ncbi:MAG: hypothetical protein GFH27_549309n123 [Chloroflexi bacterium AL-W]|nr:hypothetical protein [Chloroflexi bacterium AL-N1]NOK69825.1 hypothetical protein [Chloroflexi bacterium AL-N10]NOK73571.1 hypothetical protein [Chloroflexi bacterium AL-N5]NOK83995.1 hypothetical protein [Chloroflexi bacterium AL-W]NOK87902.1 hypothetical protein [Chloroflexi bacterium AL-N15]